jgi:hypothetical protein
MLILVSGAPVTRRRAAAATQIFASVALAAGCMSQTTFIGSPKPTGPGRISGMVLDRDARPLPDQIVAIGAEKTTTDGEGRFSFPKIAVDYDLVIASPDGTRATVYQGLSRRDPIVVHDGARVREPAHAARVFVTLSGGDAAREPWQAHFVSSRAFAELRGKGWSAEAGKTKYPDPLAVKWDGAATITGVVMVLSSRGMFAQEPVSLRAGQTTTIELSPARAPIVRRPPAQVTSPGADGSVAPAYVEEYRLPGAGFAVRGPGRAGTAYDIPDLRRFGLELCAGGFQSTPSLHSRRVQCGTDPGKPMTLALPSPPAFTAPAGDAIATPETRFAWSALPNAVYRLVLASGSGKPTAADPTIEVFTSQTTAGWPDLHAVGIELPGARATYAAVVGTSGPHTSIDDLTSPQGWYDFTPRDRWSTESKALSVRIKPN